VLGDANINIHELATLSPDPYTQWRQNRQCRRCCRQCVRGLAEVLLPVSQCTIRH